MADMQTDDEIRIKYASKYARTANYWKYYIGQTKGLKRLKVYEKKHETEKRFENWPGNLLKMTPNFDFLRPVDFLRPATIYMHQR